MNYFKDQLHSLRFFHSVSRTFVPIAIPKAFHLETYQVRIHALSMSQLPGIVEAFAEVDLFLVLSQSHISVT